MYLGLDVGTTSVCAVVLDGTGKIVYTATRQNAFGFRRAEGERLQDADGIVSLCEEIYRETQEKFGVKCVGVSGQMHGVVYVDGNGRAASPLFSWQDERGNLPYDGTTYAAALTKISGYPMATGFGGTSVFYDSVNGQIPQNAVSFCTIGDYVAMRLAEQKTPLLHETNAASLGLYDLERHRFDQAAIERAKMPFALFPKTTSAVEQIGTTKDGVAVFTAIGDNQASVYGAEQSPDSFIVNIGTGSQISLLSDRFVKPEDGEIRPYFKGRYLVLGCALCGGYSYRLLKDFFNSAFDGEEKITYEQMNAWAESAFNADLPTAYTLFRGTRKDPKKRASVIGLTENNFNAQALTLSVLKGISGELKDFYDVLSPIVGEKSNLVAAGNAIRMNPALRKIVEADYGKKLHIPAHKEEAAFGAALLAAETLENADFKHFIKYEA